MAAKENWLGSKRRRTNHDIRDFILVHGKILRESVAAEVPLSTRTKRSEAEDEDDFHPPARTLGLLGSAMAAGSGRRVKQSAISVRAGGDCSGQSTKQAPASIFSKGVRRKVAGGGGLLCPTTTADKENWERGEESSKVCASLPADQPSVTTSLPADQPSQGGKIVCGARGRGGRLGRHGSQPGRHGSQPGHHGSQSGHHSGLSQTAPVVLSSRHRTPGNLHSPVNENETSTLDPTQSQPRPASPGGAAHEPRISQSRRASQSGRGPSPTEASGGTERVSGAERLGAGTKMTATCRHCQKASLDTHRLSRVVKSKTDGPPRGINSRTDNCGPPQEVESSPGSPHQEILQSDSSAGSSRAQTHQQQGCLAAEVEPQPWHELDPQSTESHETRVNITVGQHDFAEAIDDVIVCNEDVIVNSCDTNDLLAELSYFEKL